MPKPDDTAYDNSWNELLVLLEEQNLHALPTGSVLQCCRTEVRIAQIQSRDAEKMSPGLKAKLEAYRLSLQCCIIIWTRQSDMHLEALKMLLKDAGVDYDSNRLELETTGPLGN